MEPPPAASAPTSGVLDELRARIQAVLERTSVRSAPARDVPPCELPFVSEETERGPLHVRTLCLPACHRTGRIPVAAARDARGDLLALLALDPAIARCDPARALFLDTETTGLAGGTGTVPFLVGLAFWQAGAAGGGALVLEQLFVHALGQEEPVLERVRRRIEDASLLVTFNGKSFDLPLLRARYVMSRLPAPVEPPHLDLLHVARRVHGRRVARGCRLVTLEDDVLGFVREGDIESRDVAACYLHYLRTGDGRALLGVVEHNAWDVVAMAALMGLYGEPLHVDLGANDLAGVARTLRRAGALDRASSTADAAVERGGTAEALRARADIAKARGDRARALADFEALAASVDDPSVRLELAKLYEHWVKEPARALEWAAQGTGEAPERACLRVTRLARKVASTSSSLRRGNRRST
ncbi:MAG TPA: ribonuclease H-like domain-containing protein [Polyangiaceae bacterium]|nr:ribonuclease H-like domain-containing protein [Polyangiaceae bacterium]